MAVLMFCPGSDHFSEASALIEALSIWLCTPAEQGHGPIQCQAANLRFQKSTDG
jgi:hypothetical protein